MLTEQINAKWRMRRLFRSQSSHVVALFSYRYDAHLVPGLLENIAPMVDGWIAFDDRASTSIFSDEVARRRALIGRARALGADWVLFIDPDERLEQGAAERFRTMTRVTEPVVWGFRIREMYTPDTYRIDGIWGKKQRPSLFRLREGQKFSDQPVHGPCFPIEPAHKRLPSGLNLYHLKMIAPHRREARRNLYKRLDPDNAHQRLGYDYLVEETGAVFEKIPEGRGYRPPHRDDDALWMAELPAEMAR